MVGINMYYFWEIELVDGTVLKQYNEDGSENTWKKVEKDQILRISFIPQVPLFSRHDVIIDIERGDRFDRRFGRGFLKQDEGFQLAEYINCVVTNKYRVYVFHSNGRCMITNKDQEIYI